MGHRGKRAGVLALAMLCGVFTLAPTAAATPAPQLRGDTIMLPTLDDDSRRCRVRDADLDALGGEVDTRLAACHDAADEVVNGRADELDLARVRVPRQPGVSSSASGRLTIDRPDKARVFIHRDGHWHPANPSADDQPADAVTTVGQPISDPTTDNQPAGDVTVGNKSIAAQPADTVSPDDQSAGDVTPDQPASGVIADDRSAADRPDSAVAPDEQAIDDHSAGDQSAGDVTVSQLASGATTSDRSAAQQPVGAVSHDDQPIGDLSDGDQLAGDGAVGNRSAAVQVADVVSVGDQLPGGQLVGELSAADLRRGVRLGVEARDVVRDSAVWDGTVTLTLTVTDRGREGRVDHVLRVAPLMLQHDLQTATTVFAGRPGDGEGKPDGWSWLDPAWVPGEWEAFASGLAATGVDTRFVEGTAGWWQDVWWQDMFEPATVSMPTRHGRQTMRVAIRSANIWEVPGPDGVGVRTPRPAGRLLFRDLRGPDVAVVQELVDDGRDALTDLRVATGNIESLPPYRGYPQGRLVYGSSPTEALRPEPTFIRLFTSQGQQPPVVVDTSWLLIGHADETMHVVRADNARGWTLMVADPRLAERQLRAAQAAGAGASRLFEGTSAKHQPSVAELLADREFLAENEQAARHIDDQMETMLAETGLRPDEVVRVPVLFHQPPEFPLFMALSPGIPNGLSVNARHFAAPDPHGPRVGGRDIFREATERALRANGVRVSWVEDLQWAHFGAGEVHCTTNAWRDTSRTQPWWQ